MEETGFGSGGSADNGFEVGGRVGGNVGSRIEVASAGDQDSGGDDQITLGTRLAHDILCSDPLSLTSS